MKEFVSSILILLFLTSAAWAAAGSDPDPKIPRLESGASFNPDDLYQIALQHNPDHQKALQNAELSSIGKRAAWGTLLPSLNVGYQISQQSYYQPTYTNPDGSVSSYPYSQWVPQSKILTDLTTGYQYFGWDPNDSMLVTNGIPEGKSRVSSGWISLQETLRLGGQQFFTIQNAQVNATIKDLNVAVSRQELRFLVRQAYYAILANKRLLELSRKILEQRQEQLRLASVRFEIGSVTELDVMQAEIDVGNQENAIITGENNLKLAREELNRILGVDLSSGYELADDYSLFEPKFDLAALEQQALSTRPDYQLAQQQERFNQNEAHSKRGEFLPDLTASLSHSRSQNSGNNVDFTLNPKNRNTSASLSLSWNLFAGFADEAQYEQARVALRNSRFDSKKEEQLVEKEVREAFYLLQQNYEQSRITEKNRDLAGKQLALEQERYRLGATSQLNLRAAQVTYEQAESDHIAKIFNFWSSLAALERAVGAELH